MSFVDVQLDAGLAVVTLAKPKVNALDADFLGEIDKAVAALQYDDAVRAVLFQSGIEGVFIAGADIKAFAAKETTGAAIEAFAACFNRIEQLPKPTVAAIGGHALGGGCEFALACDFRLMIDDERTVIGLPEVGLGLFPGAGGTQRLPRIVGEAVALDLVLHGKRLQAAAAARVGLITEAIPAAQFEGRVEEYARRLANGPTKALAAAKTHILNALSVPLGVGLEAEAEGFLDIVGTEDAQEGVRAFVEKRKPEFRGR